MGRTVISLGGSDLVRSFPTPLRQTIWAITDIGAPSLDRAVRVPEAGADAPAGFGLYLAHGTAFQPRAGEMWLRLPDDLAYLRAGDIVSVAADGSRVRALWRADAPVNSLLLTERCDNYCLMCSQPPKDKVDDWLLDQAHQVIELLPEETPGFILTGGEPTLYGEALLGLLRECRERLPETQIHLLSNGRRFADPRFAAGYADIGHPGLMVGIPLYGAEPSLHDYVVQASGAFDETVDGILNLAEHGQRVEIRVVVHRQTVPALVEIAEFIARNLPFVEQVSLMGLEDTGLARPNRDLLWIDPLDYRDELREAALLLSGTGLRAQVYNHQLCVTDPAIWHLCVRAISDWKNRYLEVCQRCEMRETCGGTFSTSGRLSEHLHPISVLGAPLR